MVIYVSTTADMYGPGTEDWGSCEECRADFNAPHTFEDGSTVNFSRQISVEVRGVYDGGLYNLCPDCGHKSHRWPEGSHLREKAEPFVRAARGTEEYPA